MSSDILHSINSFSNISNLDSSFTLNNSSGYSTASTYYSPHYVTNGGFHKSDIIKSVINRIAIDASMVSFNHLKIIDADGNQEPVESEFYNRMTLQANIDQTGRSFLFDLIWSMLDEGVVAAVPIDKDNAGNILSIRVGKIEQWFPRHVKVSCYNDRTGTEQSIVVAKSDVAIIESPFLTIFKNSNYTLNLLNNKVRLMTDLDNNATLGKLNGFIKLPYGTGTTYRNAQAKERMASIEQQMAASKHGIAFLENKEEFISAGGGINNNVLEDVIKLKTDFYNEVGITSRILSGEANAQEINLYNARAVDPCLQAISDAFNVAFLTKTARTQGHVYRFYRDPFRLLPIEQLASSADLFSRNAIMTPNEIRSFIGMKPHPNPLANELYNRNISDGNQNGGTMSPGQMDPNGGYPQPGDEYGDVMQ